MQGDSSLGQCLLVRLGNPKPLEFELQEITVGSPNGLSRLGIVRVRKEVYGLQRL